MLSGVNSIWNVFLYKKKKGWDVVSGVVIIHSIWNIAERRKTQNNQTNNQYIVQKLNVYFFQGCCSQQ